MIQRVAPRGNSRQSDTPFLWASEMARRGDRLCLAWRDVLAAVLLAGMMC